jgi:hypothetical protein
VIPKTKGEYVQYDPNAWRISGNCPSCLQHVQYESVGAKDLASVTTGWPKLGHRRCPNAACGQHVFFVSYSTGTETFPPMRLDFDARDIPRPIAASFAEAITCHSTECYRASALMIRRTLEELCKDRGAIGTNLKERITSLGAKVVIPSELLHALDDLRLLGNDAAHIEAQEYDSIGKAEIEIAVAFTKEVLKAVYQYAGLLTKLRGLKKQTS